MALSKQFKDLTWADLTIVGDELKAVQEFDIKTLKYKDLQTFCSQLNAMKGQMTQKHVSFCEIKVRFDKLADTSDPVRSLSVLTGC